MGEYYYRSVGLACETRSKVGGGAFLREQVGYYCRCYWYYYSESLQYYSGTRYHKRVKPPALLASRHEGCLLRRAQLRHQLLALPRWGRCRTLLNLGFFLKQQQQQLFVHVWPGELRA